MTTTLAVTATRGLDRKTLILKSLSAVLPIATIVMMIYFAINTSSFFTAGNLMAVVAQNAALFIVATVFAMLLMAGYVDLSVGSVMALCGVVAALTFNNFGVFPGIAAALLVGLALGAFNGILIGFFNISAIVVTLGLLAAARGIAQALAPNSVFGFPAPVRSFGSGDFLGIDYVVWVALLVVAAGLVIMGLTPFGKHILAVGVNPRAAFLVGLPVRLLVIALYVFTGLAAAVAGLVSVARLDSAPSGTLGAGFEVTVLTAVLLGGVPFNGGRGALWRVLVGVWFIAVLRNGLTLMNVGPEVANIVSGLVLILAAGLEALRLHLTKKF